MAKVFDYAEGIGGSKSHRKLERVVALHRNVQNRLDREVLKAAYKAEGLLDARPNRTGNSQIGVEEGDVDRYVFLEDPPTWEGPRDAEYYVQGSALAIEMKLGILKKATGY